MCYPVYFFFLFFHLSLQWCYKTTYFERGAQINELDWSEDGQYIVVGSDKKTVTVISFATSNVIWFDTLPNVVTTVKFSKTGKWLGVGQQNSDTVRIYNVPAFTLNRTFRALHSSSGDTIFQLDFNSDDTAMITCAEDGFVNQWNFNSSSNHWKQSISSGKDVLACRYADNDKIGLYCDGKMYRLRFNDGNKEQDESRGSIMQVDFRPGNHQRLYGACTDKKVYQFQTIADSIITRTSTSDDLYSLSHARDSSFIATAGKNGYITIINSTIPTALTIEQTMRRSNNHIYAVKVSKNSNYVAAGRNDGLIDIYARNCDGCPTGYYVNMSTCRSCALDLLGCASCLNSTRCLTCFNGYYYNAVTFRCIICDNALNGCLTCLSQTVCIQCSNTYYKVGNTCALCRLSTPNCQQCYNNGTCLKCSYNTYLTSSNTCSTCSSIITNCIKCYPQYNSTSANKYTLYCRQCTLGYYNSQNICLACSSNCITCITGPTCIACAQEYKLSGTTCVKCTQYCQSCNQTGTCFQCIQTTFISGGSCSLCSFPCVTCITTATTCTTCALGYYLSGTNTCSKCVGCPLCNPFNGTCWSCPIGQFLNPPSVTTCTNCLNTTSHCSLCTGSTCLACERNFYLSAGSCLLTASMTNCIIYKKDSTTECEHCNIGHFVHSVSGSCQKCSNQCLVCDSSSTCIQCSSDYYLEASNSTCIPCGLSCKTCKSSTQCLSCGDQTYLSGTQCLNCWDQFSNCNSCLNQTHCLNCRNGFRLASDSLSCVQCVSPCATCNSTGCLSCQPGFFYLSNACTRCPQNCTICTSLSACTTCSIGFALNSSNLCSPCQNKFTNCQVCSQAACIICKAYFIYNSSTLSCTSCSSQITNCLDCSNNGNCLLCQLGFYPASNKLSCISCKTTMPYCQKCYNSSVCDQCITGYYSSGINSCSKCGNGCNICSSANTCDICDAGFVKSGTSCISCSQHIPNCQVCTLAAGCSFCQLQYYLVSSTTCLLCRSAMLGCISCSSSSVCVSCDVGYFINATSKCQKCPIIGCQTCNQSTGVCLSCVNNYMLNSSMQCQQCSSIYPFCDICNNTQCLRCKSGFYLSFGLCVSCTNIHASCILCNSTNCLQCQGGLYLSNSNTCQICTIVGCQACNPNGTACLYCQNLYYKTGTTCSLCSGMDKGCLSCNGLDSCYLCITGYYLHTNGTCLLCSSQFTGCQICSATRCQLCDSNYFHNSSSVSGDCLICSSFIPGCQLCIDQTQCLLCQSGYYMQNSLCISCTVISQCLICSDNSTCLFCNVGYYQFNGQCLSCAAAIPGCFSCSNPNICLSCSGSFTLSAGICVQMKGIPARQYSQVDLKSQYVNQTHLKHTLYSIQIFYTKIEQNWTTDVKIQYILPPYTKISLTILNVEWGNSVPINSLSFYTNNPFGQIESTIQKKPMPMVKDITKTRLLLTIQQLNMRINFNMKRSVVEQILPYLDTNGNDLSLEYKLDEPEFYRQLIKNHRYYYYLFGASITGLLIIAYLIKICFVVPNTQDAGQIIPHVLLTKVSAMVIYPTLGGYINYCYGFTFVDIPWLNNFLSQALTNLSDKSPNSYKMFFNNINIASTYLVPIVFFTLVYIPLAIYEFSRKKVQISAKVKDIKKLNNENESKSDDSQDIVRKQPTHRLIVLKQYLYNIFSSGCFFYTFLNIIGMLMNKSQVLYVHGLFYIFGLLIYLLLISDCIASNCFAHQRRFHKIRIWIKSTLMALMFLSPVPIFSVMALIDIFLIYRQYQLKNKQLVVPKMWIASNSIILLSYTSLIFMPNQIIGLLISGSVILFVLCCDAYLQYFQYMQYQKILSLRSKARLYRNQNKSLNSLLKSQSEDKEKSLQNTRNFYFEQIRDYNQQQFQIQKKQVELQLQEQNQSKDKQQEISKSKRVDESDITKDYSSHYSNKKRSQDQSNYEKSKVESQRNPQAQKKNNQSRLSYRRSKRT